jgi:hypothetical protein
VKLPDPQGIVFGKLLEELDDDLSRIWVAHPVNRVPKTLEADRADKFRLFTTPSARSLDNGHLDGRTVEFHFLGVSGSDPLGELG